MTRVLVLGAGVSGLAAAALARDREMTVTIYTRDQPEIALEKGFPVASGGWDPVLLTGIDLVVASPGFPERSLPIVEALEWGIPVWSEVEFAWRHLDVPVAAVTGTNGKTTVTEAASAMLEASGIDAPAAGNIGSALSEHVDRGHAAVVVEVSSFQLRFCEEFHPTAAAITNVALDHLDWHGSEHSYRAAKARIFMNQTDEDLLVFDADDEGAASLVAGAQSELFPVSGSHLPPGGGGVDDDHLVIGGLTISIGDLVSDDPTHLVNIASASALALRMGATAEGVTKAARSFAPGPHRRSLVAPDRRRYLDRRLEGDQHPRRRQLDQGSRLSGSHRRGPGQGTRRRTDRPRAQGSLPDRDRRGRTRSGVGGGGARTCGRHPGACRRAGGGTRRAR